MPSQSKYLIFMDSRPLPEVLRILERAGFEKGDLIAPQDRAVAAYSSGTYGFVFAENPSKVVGAVPMSGHCRASEFTEEIARSLPGAHPTEKEPPTMQTPDKFEPGQRWRFVATRTGYRHSCLKPGDEATVCSVTSAGDANLCGGKGRFCKERIRDSDVEFIGMDPAAPELRPAPQTFNGLKPGDRIRFLRDYAAAWIAPKGFVTTIDFISPGGLIYAANLDGAKNTITISVDQLGKTFELDASAPAPCVFRDPQTQPKKETQTMNCNAPIKIETRTFADGTDIEKMSIADISARIKIHKADIAELEALNAEPVAKITAEIAARKAALSAFIAAVNTLPAKAAE